MMQLREMYTGGKWEGEHSKSRGEVKETAETMKSFHKDTQRRIESKQKLETKWPFEQKLKY